MLNAHTEAATQDRQSCTDPVFATLARIEDKLDALHADVQALLREAQRADELERLRFATTTQQLADVYAQLGAIGDAVGTGRGNQ